MDLKTVPLNSLSSDLLFFAVVVHLGESLFWRLFAISPLRYSRIQTHGAAEVYRRSLHHVEGFISWILIFPRDVWIAQSHGFVIIQEIFFYWSVLTPTPYFTVFICISPNKHNLINSYLRTKPEQNTQFYTIIYI